jgi:hypothetical protein
MPTDQRRGTLVFVRVNRWPHVAGLKLNEPASASQSGNPTNYLGAEATLLITGRA